MALIGKRPLIGSGDVDSRFGVTGQAKWVSSDGGHQNQRRVLQRNAPVSSALNANRPPVSSESGFRGRV